MEFKEIISDLKASRKSVARESKFKQKELKREKEFCDNLAILHALEVETFENHIECIHSLHKESSNKVNWHKISKTEPPCMPTESYIQMKQAQERFNKFKPTLFQKIFRKTDSKKEELKKEILESKLLDETNHSNNIEEYNKEFRKWQTKTQLAEELLVQNIDVCIDVLKEFNTFEEIENFGTKLVYYILDNTLCINLHLNSHEIIPKENKYLTKDGKLGTKKLSQSLYNDLHHSYICSSTLRVAKEAFSLTPINQVIITTKDEIINKDTKKLELHPILSTAIFRNKLNKLNLNSIEPSDSINNFSHNIEFNRELGFSPIEKINISS